MSYQFDVSGNAIIRNNLNINKDIISNCIITNNSILANPDVSGCAYVKNINISTGSLNIIPPGMIMSSVLAVAPVGWLLCDGSYVSMTIYSALYSVISSLRTSLNNPNIFGPDDTINNTFKLPDYRAAFLRGAGTYDTNHNATLNTSQMDTFKSHTHPVYDPGHSHPLHYAINPTQSNNSDNWSSYAVDATPKLNVSLNKTNISLNNNKDNNNNEYAETRPYNWAVNYYIKY